MHEREQLALSLGFQSFDELLNGSTLLSNQLGGCRRTYLARHPNGHWFTWDDPVEDPADDIERAE